MRIIKFRGKRLDNSEWVVGDLARGVSDKDYAISTNSIGLFEVDPSTIGQFTGLTDKNGKLIWEGDIVSFFIGGFYYTRTVYLSKSGAWCVDIPSIDSTHDVAIFLFSIENLEVIGNIHDNPEML